MFVYFQSYLGLQDKEPLIFYWSGVNMKGQSPLSLYLAAGCPNILEIYCSHDVWGEGDRGMMMLSHGTTLLEDWNSDDEESF